MLPGLIPVSAPAPPLVRSAATFASPSAVTSHAVTLPAGVRAGDLLVMFVASGNVVFTGPSGWTALFDTVAANARHIACYYKKADGSEGGTAAVATASNFQVNAITYAIANWSGTPEAGSLSSGTDAAPDPPGLSPSWGAYAALYLAVCTATVTVTGTINASPAGYGNGQAIQNSLGASTGSAQKESRAATENPGTFTLSASLAWAANTIAVKGAP